MIKEWLIRTKNNHILGPVSKEKIKQLVSSGSIKGDDEVCSGNGFWLYIREQELISKYVFGEAVQGFNPVQETLPVLSPGAVSSEKRDLKEAGSTVGVLPSENDLMYPSPENFVESQTDDTAINIGQKKEAVRTPPIPKQKVERQPPKPKPRMRNEKESAPEIPAVKRSEHKQEAHKVRVASEKVGKSLSSRKLIIFTFIFVLICAGLLFYSNTLVKKIIETSSSLLMPTAVAQVIPEIKKKNGFTTLK